MTIAKITRETLPIYAMLTYVKRDPVKALYIPTPFVIDMEGDGWNYCDRGYVVLGPDGQPYAVPAEKFEQMYDLVPEVPA